MGFSENDVPDADIGFGQTTPITPGTSTEERELTAGEEQVVDRLVAAFAETDESPDGKIPKVVATPKPGPAEAKVPVLAGKS